MHEVDSSSLKKCLLLRHVCPELEIHTMGVCDCHKQVHIGIIEHLEYGIHNRLIQCHYEDVPIQIH